MRVWGWVGVGGSICLFVCFCLQAAWTIKSQMSVFFCLQAAWTSWTIGVWAPAPCLPSGLTVTSTGTVPVCQAGGTAAEARCSQTGVHYSVLYPGTLTVLSKWPVYLWPTLSFFLSFRFYVLCKSFLFCFFCFLSRFLPLNKDKKKGRCLLRWLFFLSFFL